MAHELCNAQDRPYGGIITGSRAYAQQNDNARNIDTIPFKSWLTGSAWQYCTQRKYVGDGYALFKKKTWKTYFHLTMYPSRSAFEQMEIQRRNPRSLLHSWISSKTCGCGKTFRPTADGQKECVQCIERERKLLAQELAKRNREGEEQREGLAVAKARINLLKRSRLELQQDRNNIRNEIVGVKKKLREMNKMNEKLTTRLVKMGDAEGFKKQLANSNALNNTLTKQLKKKTASTMQLEKHERQQAKIIYGLSQVQKSQMEIMKRLNNVEASEAKVALDSEKLINEMGNITETVESLSRSNNNIESLLLETMLLDIHNLIRTFFGTLKPKKNLNEDIVCNDVREYPKNLRGILNNLGIPFGRKLSFGEFVKIIESLDKKDRLTPYSVYGEYLNAETEKMSVGHMSGNDIYFLICEYNDNNPNNGTSQRQLCKVQEDILDTWFHKSAQTLRYNVIWHMFKNCDLQKFKEITHVELSLIESTYSVIMQIKSFTNTYRKSNGKMALDNKLLS